MNYSRSFFLVIFLTFIYSIIDLYFYQSLIVTILKSILGYYNDSFFDSNIYIAVSRDQEYLIDSSCTLILISFLIIIVLGISDLKSKQLLMTFISIHIFNIIRLLLWIILKEGGVATILAHDILGIIIITFAVLLGTVNKMEHLE